MSWGVSGVGGLGVVAALWGVVQARVRGREVRRARAVLGVDRPVRASVGERWWAWLRGRPEWWCVVGGAVIGAAGASVLPVVLGVCAVPGVGRLRRARAARRGTERRREAVIRLCGLLAGEVRAGRQPGEGLIVAVRDSGAVTGARGAAVVAAARFGGDVPGALRAAAREPGAEGLGGLAACWRVAVDRGAGLAAGLERLADALRAERDQRADFRAQLAGPVSTAGMLAGLPVFGLLLGAAMGARPLRVLLHTWPGVGCLVVGGALEAAGLWWAMRIVRGAEER
ncbi:type II secretion system F family protein [Streptomyces sp. NPDC006422]|uniref:type II secretion system F family protein n=1 Tax=unclassified Streptomyces TaxID=2593676 RepID=UPI0033B4D054